MFGRQASQRLRGRSDGAVQSRRLVIVVFTMACILSLLSLQHASFFSVHLPKSKSLRDTHLDATGADWTVSKAVEVKHDPILEGEEAAEKDASKDGVEINGEEKEEKDEVDVKEEPEDVEEKDEDVRDGTEQEEEQIAGEGVDSNDSEVTEDEGGVDGILRVTLKSIPVSSNSPNTV